MLPLIQQNLPRIAELCRRYSVKRLDIFGSALDDRYDPQRSDLDFVAEFDHMTVENAADRYLGLLIDLEDLFGRKVDLVSYRAIRNPFFRQVVDRTRVQLYAA